MFAPAHRAIISIRLELQYACVGTTFERDTKNNDCAALLFFGFLAALAAIAVFVAGKAWSRHKAAAARTGAAARALCDALDCYIVSLGEQARDDLEVGALSLQLERARKIKRVHFPNLAPEMFELVKVHGEITSLSLQFRIERLGAPTSGMARLEPEASYMTLLSQARAAVDCLKDRCLAYAKLQTVSGVRSEQAGK